MPHQGVLWSPPCVALSSAPALSPKMLSPPRGPLHHLLGGAVCAKGFLALERAPGRRTGGLRLAPGGISALLHPCALLTLPPRPPAHPTLSGQNDPSDHMASFLDKRQLFLLLVLSSLRGESVREGNGNTLASIWTRMELPSRLHFFHSVF